jgi:hypothetical protein
MSTAGYPGIRGGYVEPPVVTAGDASVKDVRALQVEARRLTYSAAEAITRILRGLEDPVGGSSRLLERRAQAARGAAHQQPAP